MSLLGEKLCLFCLALDFFKKCKNPTPTSKQVYDETKKTREDYAYSEQLWKDGQRILNLFKPAIDIRNKLILDVGCGNGGKAVYYAKNAKYVFGCDIDKTCLERAENFSAKKGLTNKTKFVYGESTDLPFNSNKFDIIMMNDVMEHFANPLATILESKRVLKKGGIICINFAAWLSPNGSHLNDWIHIPWCHVLFSEKTLIKVLKKLSLSEKYIEFQFPNINNPNINKNPLPKKLECLGSGNLNRITLRQFKKILNKSGLKTVFFELKGIESKRPLLKKLFQFLVKMPLLNEFFGGEIVIVLKK